MKDNGTSRDAFKQQQSEGMATDLTKIINMYNQSSQQVHNNSAMNLYAQASTSQLKRGGKVSNQIYSERYNL